LKAKEIRDLQAGELAKKLNEKQRELLDLRFKAATKQIKNTRQLPQIKKDIARLKTVSRQHELGTEQT
jgi:large subunit ribosomal protein L29